MTFADRYNTGLRSDGLFTTRRGLLVHGGYLIGGAILGAPRLFGQSPGPTVPATNVSPAMEKLSTYMGDAASHALPPGVSEQVKLHILDTFAAMISGSQLPPGRAAVEFAKAYGGEAVATVVASNLACGPIEAAMTNGVLAHSDETDDSHSPSQSHPGCAVVPAALASAERFSIGGLQFLRAVALGYDIGTRVGMTLGGVNYQTESHRDPHATSSGFGAAAAAGCAASLNAIQARALLDYAAQQSAGIAAWQRDTQHFEKAFVFAGMPARNGVTAALLVHAGWGGVGDIFSGTDNFFAAFGPDANLDRLVDKLGERFEITRTNIKKWCVGSPIQAPLDALDTLLKQRAFTADQVKSVVVRVATREATIVDNRNLPDICLQHLIAVMLVQRTISFKSAHDGSLMNDPSILRERAKVSLIGDEELERRLPAREATVHVTLQDGITFSQHVDAVRGTAENPMTRDEVAAKARDLMEPILGASRCATLVNTILQLESVKDVHELRPLFRVDSILHGQGSIQVQRSYSRE
jgi:2-methylcitrate dehydratase PrpD